MTKNNDQDVEETQLHRKTIFAAGAKKEGITDRPYDEGDVL